MRIAAFWWALHVAPQPRRTLGNIGTPGWRPRPRALLIGFPAFTAITLSTLVIAERLSRPWAEYLGWALSLVAVFAYVATVTTGRGGNPLRGRHGGFRDIIAVQLVGLLVFLIADHRPDNGHGAVFALGLILGAHLSYVEKLPTSWARSITAANWRSAGFAGRLSIAARLVLVGAAVVAVCLLAVDRWAIVAGGILLLVLWWISRAVRPAGYFLHVHHWFVFGMLAVLGAQAWPVLAVSMGAFVEGAARWSCAPLWHRRV